MGEKITFVPVRDDAEIERLGTLLRETEDALTAAAERIILQAAVVREARYLSEHIYPPDVWLPDAAPPETLGEGERAVKRMNAGLVALDDWKRRMQK